MYVCLTRKISNQKEEKKEQKEKQKAWKLWDIRKILTKNGIYFSYLKCVCSSKEKYYKSQDEYLGN